MNDLRHVQVEREPVPRTHGDGRQLRVVIVRLGERAQSATMFVVGTAPRASRACSPVLARYNGVTQTPLCPGFTRSPCLKSVPLTSSCAIPTNEMTTPTCPIGISQHRNLLHLRKPRIQVPRAGQQDCSHVIRAAAAFQECLSILEVVVVGDERSGDFAVLNRPASRVVTMPTCPARSAATAVAPATSRARARSPT